MIEQYEILSNICYTLCCVCIINISLNFSDYKRQIVIEFVLGTWKSKNNNNNSKIVEETLASEMFWKTCYLKLCDMILKSNVWIWNGNKVRKWKKTLMNHNNMYGEIYVDYVFPDRSLLCDTWHFILFKWLPFVSMLILSFLFFWFNIQLVYIWMLFDLC